MKKALYSLLAFATLLFAASCAKEPANVADPALGGKPVTATFSVNLGGALTKADTPVNSTLDDGSKVNVLYVGAFDAEGNLISTSKVDGSIPVENKKASVSLTLSKGVKYQLVFFAEVKDKYVVTFGNGTASFAYPDAVVANDPELDAFYKTMEFTPDGKNMTQDVVLTRPFAQLNVFASKVPADKTTDYVSTMTITGAPTTFDLFAGKAGEPADAITFTEAAIDAASVGKYAEGGATPAKWVGMNFILVPDAGTVDVTFNETDMVAPLSLTGIAVKENVRTNLYGNIYGLGDYTFNVTVDEKFGEEGETPIDANEVTYVIDDGQTYTAENPLVLDTDAVKSVSVTINGVDGSQITLSEVNANPVEAGKQVVVSSSNTDVATVALDGDAIKITPKANGDAVITIETPSFTKATYAAAVAKIYIQVTGMAVEPVDPELTVSGAPAEAVSEAFNLTVTTNSTGEISWTVAPEGAATVAAGEKAGEYIVTPADNLTEDTPVTATFTVAAAEGFNAASKEVKFTVKAAETPVEPGEGPTVVTVAEFLAKDVSETDQYQLTGIITSIASSVFGNLDLKDDSGSVYVYGVFPEVCSYGDTNPRTFEDLGLKVGDQLTIIGYRGVYNDSPQAVYSYYVSHIPAADITLAATQKELTVGDTFELNVQTNGGAVTYSSSDASVASVSDGIITAVAAGTATITVNVAATEATMANSATCTVTVNAAGSTTVWVKKSLSSLVDGDVFVLTSVKEGETYYAMSNGNGTTSAPAAIEVTVSEDKLSASPDVTLQWVAGVNNSGIVFYVGAEKKEWLYCINNNNGLRVGTGDGNIFTINESDGYLLNSAQTRYVGVYNKQDWRSYTSVNNNIKDQTFNVFVKTTVAE
ncbi:MAG: FimB/Mfa2 family fimbrial subunit [Bacteroidales bacterium]|nr:FimB/Mfa2 family fimbrial subunit [Bacteroidales bacterium]MBR1578658.1 FimB/Mfa2 family fimbrial subunit [Bacteroidales bacterium]